MSNTGDLLLSVLRCQVQTEISVVHGQFCYWKKKLGNSCISFSFQCSVWCSFVPTFIYEKWSRRTI